MRRLTINERYALTLSSGYDKRSGLGGLENPNNNLYEALLGYVPTPGLPSVTDESALTLAAVYACNRVLADTIASLPISLYHTTPDGDTMPAGNRPEHRLVADQPSELYTSYTFRSTGQFHLGMRGNFYARIYRDGRGGATELRILHPNDVRPFFYNNRLFYEVMPRPEYGYAGQREILTPSDILHVAGLGSDGIIGKSPIGVLRDTIGIGLANREYVKNIHKNGGRVRGVIKTPNKPSAEQVAEMRENFKKPLQNGEFPVLSNGAEFQSISLTPQDAEFINTAKLTRNDICSAYRVPPHMIGDLERATFSNIEHQSLDFVKNTLLPWIKNWEAELNRKLLPVTIQSSHYFRFNVEGLLRGDINNRFRAYTQAIQWGILNRDEVRELENRNRIPDGLGQVFLTPLNMAPLTEETAAGIGITDNSTQQNGATQ